MILPKLDAKENNRVQIKVFGGLDRRDKISDMSLTGMTNMSSSAMPALTPREGRRKIADVPNASEICAPEYSDGDLNSFTGVIGTKFYYKGTQISGTLSASEKSIADFNGKICIFPDKKYYDYIPDSKTGNVAAELKSMEKSAKFNNAEFHSSYDEVSGSYSAYISGASLLPCFRSVKRCIQSVRRVAC